MPSRLSRPRQSLPVLLCCAAGAWVLAAAPVTEQAGTNDDSWFGKLADPSFEVREQASAKLWADGKEALPRLRKLTKSADPEQATRARELVRKIEMGIFPDSDPDLLAIIEEYPKASATAKTALIRELQNRQAWRQMLKLHQEETSPTVRQQQERSMQRIAVHAAREKLAQGHEREALEFLEMAPPIPDSLLTLAEFHRLHGTLEEELEKARGKPGVEMAAWRCALHRCAGNLPEAIREAKAAQLDHLAAGLAVLGGDPLPWLDRQSREPEEGESRRVSDRVRILYAQLAAQRWRTGQLTESSLEPLREMIQNRSSQMRRSARTALFMLGDTQVSESSLEKGSPMRAVQHLLLMERVEEALRILETTTEQPCTELWVHKRFRALEEDDFEEFDGSREARALHVMAGFLEGRGLGELAFSCYRDPALEFAKRDEQGFLSFLMFLLTGGDTYLPAPELAVELAADWAAEDQDRWAKLTDFLWAGDDDSMVWWNHLGAIKPRSTRAQRLRGVMVLMRRIHSRGDERGQWLDLAWQHHQALDEDDRRDSIRKIADLAFQTEDANLSARIWNDMPEDIRDDYHWRQRAAHHSARDEWNEVCEILLDQVKQFDQRSDGATNPAFHAYAAAALRRAGREEDAKLHDQKAELLALGDPSMAMQIATAYAFADDYERSRWWWRRAALHSAPDSGMYVLSLVTYGNTLHEQVDQWPVLAAMAEVAACQSMETSYYDQEIPLVDMRMRLKSDTFRALSQLGQDRSRAIELLEQSHTNFITDGALADYFFPVLRIAGLTKEHDRWFERSWQRFEQAISLFPDSHNTRNTAGWFASRAQRQLKRALEHQRHALKVLPEQSAYLDTMAEIHFAMGQRKEAMKWSRKAILLDPTDAELRRQFHHFRNDPMPK